MISIRFFCTLFFLPFAAVSVADLPFPMPDVQPPVFPDRTFTITDYQAVPGGLTKNTEAIAKAIDACAEAGGGRVVVPAGLWLTGPIELKSRVNLHLEQNAVLLFSTDIEDYPLKEKTFEGTAAVRRMSPITAENCESIAITGPGVIDGSGQAWRPVKKDKLTESQWKKLVRSGGVVDDAGRIWYPSEQSLKGSETVARLRRENTETAAYAAAGEHLRPVMISLVNCRNVLLEETTFQNSPAWNIHPLLCENMIIRNISVRNPWWSQNGDGLDLESCRNVFVTGCRFDVGDDAICMKSGKDEYGRQRGRRTENVVIRDCIVYHGHGGFTVGSEMSGGVRNIFVSNCSFLGTDVGIRFKSTRGRGGVVENIWLRDILMTDIPTDAIRFNLFYAGKAPGPEEMIDLPPDPVTEETPAFRKIYLRNITCRGAANAIYMQGLPEMPVRQVEMENLLITADAGATCVEAEEITFKNVRILPKDGPAFALYNAREITFDGVEFPAAGDPPLKLAGPKTKAIQVKNSGSDNLENRIEYTAGAAPVSLK